MTNEELVLEIQRSDENSELMGLLYKKNSGLIHSIAKRFCGSVELEDLMQEAYISLCKACSTWKSEGSSFMTYCYNVILWDLQKYVYSTGLSIRIPDGKRNEISKYMKFKDEYMLNKGKKPSDRELMLYLGVNIKQLRSLEKAEQMISVKSLDMPVIQDDESISLVDIIADDVDHIEQAEERMNNQKLAEVLWQMVDALSPDQAVILHERYQNNKETKEIAEVLHNNANYVKTSENRAMKELRKHKNQRKLRPFLNDSSCYSIGIAFSGHKTFIHTWTSAPEKAVLLAEAKKRLS